MAAGALYAQGNGQAGITEATQMVTSYFDPGTKLVYAIGAVVGLIGGIKVYNKFSSGDPDTSKTAASWFGACIFLIVAATTEQGHRAERGVQGAEGTIPVHLRRRTACRVRGVHRDVHGRNRPMGVHRLWRGIRIDTGMAHIPPERQVRRARADETARQTAAPAIPD